MGNAKTSDGNYHPIEFVNGVSSQEIGETEQSLRWQRWDVSIDNVITSPNRFDVTEDQYILVERGTFHRFYRTIALRYLISIENIHVYLNDLPLAQGATGEAGTFTPSIQGEPDKVTKLTNYQKIALTLPMPASEGTSHHVRLTYTINGALRSYQSGDQLIWPALPTHRDYAIDRATVRVAMPHYRPARRVSSIPNTWKLTRAKHTLTWQSPSRMGKLNGFEARIEYDHDPQMLPPPWQGTLMKKPMAAGRKRPFLGCALIVAMVIACMGFVFAGSFLRGYNTCMGVEGGTFGGCVGYGFTTLGTGGNGYYSGGSTYVNSGDTNSSVSSSSGSFSSSSDDSGSSSSDSSSDSGDSGGDGGDAGGD